MKEKWYMFGIVNMIATLSLDKKKISLKYNNVNEVAAWNLSFVKADKFLTKNVQRTKRVHADRAVFKRVSQN